MIEVEKQGILLKKTGLPFENERVLNPAVIRDGSDVHLYYRAVSTGNHSTIGYCRLNGPLEVTERYDHPIVVPGADYESQGVEDPRITKIGDTYYLTYTAYDGINALGALAVSSDALHFEKKGIIVPQMRFDEFQRLTKPHGAINEKYLRYNEQGQVTAKQGKPVLIWDKNLMFFPRRINGMLYFLHRIKPDIQIASVKELNELSPEYWAHYFTDLTQHILMTPRHKHEVSYIGGGCPPIETKSGWLLIYHSVHDTIKGFVYSACAALLDLENPNIELARLPYPLFKPELEWELNGEVNNVCFPSGAALFDDRLFIYYGAADEQIAVAAVSFSGLLKELMLYSKKKHD